MLGGPPSKGTKADKRLAANKPAPAAKPATPATKKPFPGAAKPFTKGK